MTFVEALQRPFELAEYHGRIAQTKQRMSDQGIDLLIVSDPANLNYLTGYDGWSFQYPQCAIISLDADEPIFVCRGTEIYGARMTTFLKEESILAYPDDYVVHVFPRNGMDFVAEVIQEKRWSSKKIGLEMNAHYFTARGYQGLLQGLPNAEFKNAQGLVNWIRAIKSPAEISYMEEAARILESVMDTFIDRTSPGVRQCDVAAELAAAQIRGTPAFGGDYPAGFPPVITGPRTAAPHLFWTDDPLKVGDIVITELAGCRHRYHVPMARTIFLGKPPQKVVDAAKAAVEGLNCAIESAKPGATCEEVELAWRKAISDTGIVKESRIGYSVGLNYPPDWNEHTMSFYPGDRSEIEPNMTFHIMPGLWMEGFGVSITEPVHITDNGARLLANVPRELVVKN